MGDMENRIEKLENKVDNIEKSYLRLESKVDLILYRINEFSGRSLATLDDVKNEVGREVRSKKKDCIAELVSIKDFPVLWEIEHNKKQSSQSKIIKAVFWVMGVIVTTIATVVSGLADYITK